MVREALLLSGVVLMSAGSSARADEGGQLVLERAASDPLPHWEVHFGAAVGAARASMLGSEHAAVAVSVDLEAVRWLDRHTGLGLYLGEIVAQPWTRVEMDDHGVVRDLPFIVEPEVVHRSVHRHSRWLATGWTAALGAGVVFTRTEEMWSHLLSQQVYEKTLEHGVEAGTTAQLTAFVHAGPVAVSVGPRVSLDTAGDAAIGLEATAGASW